MSIYVKIRKDFGSFCLDVELTAEGGVLALLGASGCGKSLTLRSIAGIVRPDEGRIEVDGRVLFDSKQGIDLPPQKREVGLLFQNYALFPHMTVEENLFAGARREKQKQLRQSRVREALSAFHLEGLEKRYPAQLSGGQQQRVALARILVSGPRLLMLDEPFSALDSHLRWEMEQVVKDTIRRFQKPVLFVSHDRAEVFRLSQRIAVLSQGKIQQIGDKAEVFARPVTKESALLTGCRNLSRIRRLGERKLEALDWGLILECAEKIPQDAAFVGLRSHELRLAAPGDANSCRLRVAECIENPFSRLVLLQKDKGEKGEEVYEPLNWEPGPQEGQKPADILPGCCLEFCLPPEKLLLLK